MVAPKINMHGKIYDLYDEIDRPQVEAKKKLAEIHKSGKRAFLNPRKRKDMETTYYIYTADPTPRKVVAKKEKVEKPKAVKPKAKISAAKIRTNGKKNEKKNGK